ncbi:MAG: methyltransferase domain-containing protein [Deltaproteobacteria bacterium]|jgi:ubiquinone/menaquinone biosynthesis C-methylase UbiE|nr:methyltransferase domain-containing protein [Deltaproteobacteria bacterium]
MPSRSPAVDFQSFSSLSKHYQSVSRLQRAAGAALLDLLDIRPGESVLDVGCGTGDLARRIKSLSGSGRVCGIDPSEGMIAECARLSPEGLEFSEASAETMSFKDEFDVVFCNSAFNWIENISLAVSNMREALREDGRLGVQAPATSRCSPNFSAAVGESARDPAVRETISKFRSPWFWRETPEQYAEVFETAGFKVRRAEIRHFETLHTREEVFRIFCSGAIIGYMNPDCYPGPVSEEHLRLFQERVKQSLYNQADDSGMVKLFFHRIFLVADKA